MDQEQPAVRELWPGSGIRYPSGCEDGWPHEPMEPNGTEDGMSTCRKCNNDVPVGYADAASEPRCPKCMAPGGHHGLIHIRHGNGGGHNERCPLDPSRQQVPSDQEQE